MFSFFSLVFTDRGNPVVIQSRSHNQRINGPVNAHLFLTALLVGELMTSNDPCPGAWPVCIPGAQETGFIKRITEHCYIQNIKSS